MDPFMAHTEVLAPWKEEGDYFAVHIDVRSCEREGIKVEMKDRMIKITFERTGIVNRTVFDNIRRQEKVGGGFWNDYAAGQCKSQNAGGYLRKLPPHHYLQEKDYCWGWRLEALGDQTYH